MNRILGYSLVVMGVLLLLTNSCKKDDNNNIPPETAADFDGNLYHTITIGKQVWLAENLKVSHYLNGDPILNVTAGTAWGNLTTGAYCDFNNTPDNSSTYGKLYNYYAVVDNRNLCPLGWHVSTNEEWLTAETYLGGADIAGGKMKEAGATHWASPNTGATNTSRFTGLPGGMRESSSIFSYFGENGLWWTSTEYNSSMVWSAYLWYLFAGVDHNPTLKNYGLSVRCVKD